MPTVVPRPRAASEVARRPVREASAVRLLVPVPLWLVLDGEGTPLAPPGPVFAPAGSCGTVVAVHGGGAAYDVEFAAPVAGLATVEAGNLEG